MVSRDELFHEISMPYQDLVDYLKEKYGPARYNYFYKDNCRSRRPEVSRTTEGLICHHIREDMGGNLSNKSQAIIQPYEWQLKQNLVYCNLLEHLLLHFKIAVLRQKAKLKQPYDILQFFTTDGIYMVANQINGLFKKNGTQTKWLNNLGFIENLVVFYLENSGHKITLYTKRWFALANHFFLCYNIFRYFSIFGGFLLTLNQYLL